MIELFVLKILVFTFALALLVHKKLLAIVDQPEDVVMRESGLCARSHRLIAEGIKIDQMEYSFEKHQAYQIWIGKLHEYMGDYEHKIAETRQKNDNEINYGQALLADVIMLNKQVR
jgi:hypothetical protein